MYALEALSRSRVRKVIMVGRRGPLQAAFTTAELREILKLQDCKTFWREQDFENVQTIVPTLDRPRKRLTELMLKSLEESKNDSVHAKELHQIFLRSPIEFHGNKELQSIKFAINHLRGETIQNQVAETTGKFEEIPCGLALRSIGYKTEQIYKDISCNAKMGCLENINGKIEERNGERAPLYVAGWAGTGPTGVILTTMRNAFQVARLIYNDLPSNLKGGDARRELCYELCNKNSVQTVSYEDWLKIDRIEQQRGKQLGKVREKIVNVHEMLKIAENRIHR